MGEIVNICCKSCSAHWECRVGSGMLHGSLESVAGLFSEKQREEIESYAKQTLPPLFSFSFRTSRCKNCAAIVGIPVLTLTETGVVYTAPCPDCGAKLRPIIRLSKSGCPACGKTTLESELTGRWD